MIAPNDSQTSVQIVFLPQEKDGSYRFAGPLVATPAAIDSFGMEIILAAYLHLLHQVHQKDGLDYLQVVEINGQRLWFIDDVDHCTALLPSDY